MITKTLGPFRSLSFLVGLAQALLWVVLAVYLVNLVSEFVQLFEDFRMELPSMTIAVINLTALLERYWYLALILACLWPFANWVVVSVLSARPNTSPILRRLWYGMTWSIPFLLVGIAVTALFMPLLDMGGRLS